MKSHTQFKVKKKTIMKYDKISACACHLLPRELPRNSLIISTAKPFASQYQFSFVVFFLNGLARVLQMKVSRVINW